MDSKKKSEGNVADEFARVLRSAVKKAEENAPPEIVEMAKSVMEQVHTFMADPRNTADLRSGMAVAVIQGIASGAENPPEHMYFSGAIQGIGMILRDLWLRDHPEVLKKLEALKKHSGAPIGIGPSGRISNGGGVGNC
jgi:hypothetical protein